MAIQVQADHPGGCIVSSLSVGGYNTKTGANNTHCGGTKTKRTTEAVDATVDGMMPRRQSMKNELLRCRARDWSGVAESGER